MASPAYSGVGTQQASELQDILTTSAVSYRAFKNTVLTLHRQGTAGVDASDYRSLAHGLHLLNEWGNIFPAYAARLADDPEFLS